MSLHLYMYDNNIPSDRNKELQYNVLDLYKAVATHFFWEIKMQWSFISDHLSVFNFRVKIQVIFKSKLILFYFISVKRTVHSAEWEVSGGWWQHVPLWLQSRVLAMVSQAKKSHTHTLRDHHLDRFCLENHVLKQPLTIGLVLLLNLLETDRNALPLTTFEWVHFINS